MQAGEEIARGFFVAGRDASELFDELKETLDEVGFGVKGELQSRVTLRFDFGGMTGLMARTSRF